MAEKRETAGKDDDSVHKAGACPSARSAEQFSEAASIVAEFAAGCAGAFAQGMRVFSETMGAQEKSKPNIAFVEATTEASAATLNELSAVIRRHRDRLIKPDKGDEP